MISGRWWNIMRDQILQLFFIWSEATWVSRPSEFYYLHPHIIWLDPILERHWKETLGPVNLFYVRLIIKYSVFLFLSFTLRSFFETHCDLIDQGKGNGAFLSLVICSLRRVLFPCNYVLDDNLVEWFLIFFFAILVIFFFFFKQHLAQFIGQFYKLWSSTRLKPQFEIF